MAIDVGQIIDKYELIEKVGQGGMAVVYRGLDRSLRRPVAVKVLHRHLAEHQEARDRFEREAHAVAKLRHENILEIFDFSGNDSEDSYIVTEFIDGQTLREFIAEHQLEHPELGAMIAVQVCRALGHAHSLGVLHRDVKPENIMIRSDGVVKLMDFGIAQMLDIERLTVTGQLLGSPAYMAPEHVEGGQLDFRTDVFSVGIVLYQLVTGTLPFQGKNPHEILKKIAEGTYRDPRTVNPMIGNELGRIINRALAREPADRFADITEMLGALERYLEGSGLSDHRAELARFFEGPASYQIALRQRLLAHLTRRGQQLVATDQVAALELFNRVLTIDPDNEVVLAELDRLSRRTRYARMVALAVGVALIGLGLFAARRWWPGDAAPPAIAVLDAGADPVASAPPDAADTAVIPIAPPDPDHVARDDAAPMAMAPDAGPDAGSLTPVDVERRPHRTPDRPAPPRQPGPDAAVSAAPAVRSFTLDISPPGGSEYRVNAGPWQPAAGGAVTIQVPPGAHVLEIRNPRCCEPLRHTISARQPGGTITLTLDYLPATITPICSTPGVIVQIDNRALRQREPKLTIPMSSPLGKTVTISFVHEGTTDAHTVTVSPGDTEEVRCRFD